MFSVSTTNSILIIKDDRAPGEWIPLSSINECEPLLVSWEPSRKNTLRKIHIGLWSLKVAGKAYDNYILYMSDDPICSELQDEEMVGDLEQVVHIRVKYDETGRCQS